MELFFTCPNCSVQMQIEAQFAGRDAKCPECQEDINIPPLQLGPGVVVGGFLLERKLGSGSMGDVYLAEQISMRRKVALKILPASMTRDPQSVERFLHEVQTLGRFEHPNIVQAFDAGEDDGTYYLAMSYVNGENLDEIVKRDGPMEEKKALKIIRKVAIALQFAWKEHQLLHRDIKPENVMIDHLGEIRLMDMGISKSAHEDSNLTMPGIVFGTPHYMSPEQAWSEGAIDFRADLYSLGASLYRMIVGDPPYTGPSQTVFAKLAKPDPFPLPRTVKPEISEACDHLVDVMMAPKPEDRYQDWDACIADLDRVIAGKSPTLKRPSHDDGDQQKEQVKQEASASASKLRPLGDRKNVIQPKDRSGKQRPKLSLSRTEQMKAPALPGAKEAEEAESDQPAKQSDSKGGLQLKSPVKRKPAPPEPPAEEPAIAAEDALPSEVSGKKSLLRLGASSRLKKAILGGAAVLCVLALCGVVYMLFNPDLLGDLFASLRSSDNGQVVTPEEPPTGTTEVTDQPEPPTPENTPPPEEDEPTFEELSLQARAEIERRTQKISIDEAQVAKSLGLEPPVQKPRYTPEEIEQLASRQAKKIADERFKLDEHRADYREEALELFGAFQEGQEVFLTLRDGSGPNASVRGILHEINPTRLRVGDRTISVRDLAPADRERLDKDIARQNVENYIDRTMADLVERHEKYYKRAKDALIEDGHEKSGYVKRGGAWVSAYELVQKRVEQMRNQQIRDIRTEVEDAIFKPYGYVRVGNRWQKP